MNILKNTISFALNSNQKKKKKKKKKKKNKIKYKIPYRGFRTHTTGKPTTRIFLGLACYVIYDLLYVFSINFRQNIVLFI